MRVAAERILIVLLGAIGDVTRALPLAMRLRAAYPQARIAWAVEPAAAPLLENHPALDERLVFARAGGAAAFLRFLRRVRAGRFDLVVDLQRHLKSGFVSVASRAPVRIGFHRRNSKELNWLFNTHTIAPVDERGWKLEQYQRFAALLELPEEAPRFGITLRSDEEARVDALNARGMDTVILGGADARPIAAATAALARRPPLDLSGQTSLREVYGVLARARLAIGPDSGPMHLAAAAGTPVVSLWGATTPARSAPFRSEDFVLVGRVPCAPCYRRRCPIGRQCMQAITPARVLAQVSRILER